MSNGHPHFDDMHPEELREAELAASRRKRTKKRLPNFATDPAFEFDYKDVSQLKYFLTDRGKIVPRRVSGLTAKQQRSLTTAIKRARNIALLPYTAKE